jgi:hypothetical protein
MAKTIRLRLPERSDFYSTRQSLSCKFPPSCVYCGQLSQTQFPVAIRDSKTYRMNHRVDVTQTFQTQLPVPYCTEHANLSKRNNTVRNYAGLAGALIFSIIWIINAGVFNADTSDVPPWWLLAGIVLFGLAPIGYLVFFSLSKYILAPFYKSIPHQFGWFSGGGALGVAINLEITPTGGNLIFQFSNDNYAREFSMLNGSFAE